MNVMKKAWQIAKEGVAKAWLQGLCNKSDRDFPRLSQPSRLEVKNMKFVTIEEIKSALEIRKTAKAKAADNDKEVYSREEWCTGIVGDTSWDVHRKVDVPGRFTAQIKFTAWISGGKCAVGGANAVIRFHAPEMGSAEDAEEMAEVICEDFDLLKKIAQELRF